MRRIADIHRTVLIELWIEATDAAIVSLSGWKSLLIQWQDESSAQAEQIEAAVADLDGAGLGEWAEWGAGLGLDILAAQHCERLVR